MSKDKQEKSKKQATEVEKAEKQKPVAEVEKAKKKKLEVEQLEPVAEASKAKKKKLEMEQPRPAAVSDVEILETKKAPKAQPILPKFDLPSLNMRTGDKVIKF